MRKSKSSNLLDVKEAVQNICANSSTITCALLNKAKSITAYYTEEDPTKVEISVEFEESGISLSSLQEVIAESFAKAAIKAIKTIVKETGYTRKEDMFPTTPVNRHEIL